MWTRVVSAQPSFRRPHPLPHRSPSAFLPIISRPSFRICCSRHLGFEGLDYPRDATQENHRPDESHPRDVPSQPPAPHPYVCSAYRYLIWKTPLRNIASDIVVHREKIVYYRRKHIQKHCHRKERQAPILPLTDSRRCGFVDGHRKE